MFVQKQYYDMQYLCLKYYIIGPMHIIKYAW